MGMFDTIHIHKKFLPSVKELKQNGYNLSSLQTKVFDNLLEDYHVGEDGLLYMDKVEYEFTLNTNTSADKKWNPPFFQEEKSRTKMQLPHTGIVTAGAFFMDYHNPKDEIFIDIDFKFIDGVLQGQGIVNRLTVTPINIVLERRREIEERRNRRDNDPLYHISKYFLYIVNRVISKLHRIQNYLLSYEPK